MNLQIDEELQSLIPSLSPDELRALEESVLREGIRDAIVVWNGVIIDGHNRYSLSQKHGLEFETMERDFESKDDVKAWMINNQLGRRNLTDGWKFDLVLQLLQIRRAKAKVISAERKERINLLRNKTPKQERENCFVCGEHKAICHAHHLLPVAEYIEMITKPEEQITVWLCPNHHAILHLGCKDGWGDVVPLFNEIELIKFGELLHLRDKQITKVMRDKYESTN